MRPRQIKKRLLEKSKLAVVPIACKFQFCFSHRPSGNNSNFVSPVCLNRVTHFTEKSQGNLRLKIHICYYVCLSRYMPNRLPLERGTKMAYNGGPKWLDVGGSMYVPTS